MEFTSLETEDVQEQEIVPESKIVSESSKDPFKTAVVAKAAIKREKLSLDDYEAYKVDKGYAVRLKYVEEYWWVLFQERMSLQEQEDVEISVNGETLKFQRGRETIVPGRFLGGADGTTYFKFTQIPGQGRKKGVRVMTFPYTRLKKSSEAEFKKLKLKGDRKTKELIRKCGYDFNPGDFDEDE